jgi:hypothetical protein
MSTLLDCLDLEAEMLMGELASVAKGKRGRDRVHACLKRALRKAYACGRVDGARAPELANPSSKPPGTA